ncbi:MAG: hypothetical protein JRD89_16195 [Deltaproteobacteria bacterium]|nr:hypothetical protein [Deltaproteobacteria bacterium]
MAERDRLRIVIDLDGTILEERVLDEKHLAKPLPLAVKMVNRIIAEGHEVVIYTSRPQEMDALTERQLRGIGIDVNLVGLVMDKPKWDIVIDNRAVRLEDWGKDWPNISRAMNERMNTPRGL